MKIHADGLGYRELGRIADFIQKIEEGHEGFEKLVEDGDDEVEIGYDVYADDVTIRTGEFMFYPEDLE